MAIKIIPFKSHYAPIFRELNVAWLEKYFYVEAKDKEILENCENFIIDKGGYIFFAAFGKHLVGCFSFIKLDDKIYELGKMAVDPQYQGRKIGQDLLEFAISFARDHKWKKIVLYSHTKLDTAIYIYKKHGFTEIQLESNTPYERCNIKMELVIG